MSDKLSSSPVILRLKELKRHLALSRSAIYSRIAAGDFPPPLQLGPRAIGWRQADIDAWLESRTRHGHTKAVAP
jgi:prophage regulatory protein